MTMPSIDFHEMSNSALGILETSSGLSSAITSILLFMVGIYFTDASFNMQMGQDQYGEVLDYLQGGVNGDGVSDNFDGNNSKNDPAIWSNKGKDPNTDSKDMQLVQADIANVNAWFKSALGMLSSMLSSGTSYIQATQQNETQLFAFMGGANEQTDYTGSLLAQALT